MMLTHTVTGALVLLSFALLLALWRERRVGERRPEACDGVSQARRHPWKWHFLSAYWLAVTPDWLFGPHLYSLYRSYGLDLSSITFLSLVGFLTTATLGLPLGYVSDRFGHKIGAIIQCFATVMANVLVTSSEWEGLVAGRVASGIGSGLLGVAYESWMVAVSAEAGNKDLLSPILSTAFAGSGFLAIMAGLASESMWIAFDSFKAPFILAALLAALNLLLILSSWHSNGVTREDSGELSFSELLSVICSQKEILLVGITQATFEAAMFGMIFSYAPTLELLSETMPPFGLVFACWMVALMLGSKSGLIQGVYEVAAVALISAAVSGHAVPNFIFLTVYEFCVGVYFVDMAEQRLEYLPERLRGRIVGVYGVLMNLFVIVMLLIQTQQAPTTTMVTSGMLLAVAAMSRRKLEVKPSGPTSTRESVRLKRTQ